MYLAPVPDGESWGHLLPGRWDESQITKIEQLPLNQVRDILFHEEGALSPEQFEQIFRSQHLFWGWDESEIVFVHYFDTLT